MKRPAAFSSLASALSLPAPLAVRLRAARGSDIPALDAILAQWVAETGWLPQRSVAVDNAAALSRLLARGEVTCLVARRPGREEILGFLAREGAEVHALYVAAHARGRGHGARLMRRAKAASAVLRLWVFAADDRARRFYAREGFRETGRGDGTGNDYGMPELRLEWRRGWDRDRRQR